MSQSLALLGGPKAIKYPFPHEIWPPEARQSELDQLARQRNLDISIRGRAGPIAELEDAFLAFLDHKLRYAVTFNSGTSALLAAYFSLGVERGVEVVGPALTYHAALSPVFTLGGDVVLADVERGSRCIDPADIERRITPRTRVITVVHQWGHPADMDQIMAVAARHDLRVVEDCSHAHGSRYKGRLCGSFGDVAVFSLQTNKTIFAGEGGVLVTNEAKISDRATLLGHYRDRCRANLVDEELKRYWVTGFGLKLRMSPFNAITALHSLADFPRIKQDKHRCLNYFRERLAEVDYIEPPSIAPEVDMGAWYGFKPIFRSERLGGVSRDLLVRALRAEGMEVDGPSGPTLSTQPLYNEARDPLYPGGRGRPVNLPESVPTARFIEQNALSLPTFWQWDQDRPIIDAYCDAFAKVGAQIAPLRDYQG